MLTFVPRTSVHRNTSKKRIQCLLSLYHFSIVDLQTCSPDDLLPAVLDQIPMEEVDGGNSDYRQYDRISSLMSVCPDEPV